VTTAKPEPDSLEKIIADMGAIRCSGLIDGFRARLESLRGAPRFTEEERDAIKVSIEVLADYERSFGWSMYKYSLATLRAMLAGKDGGT
jgi:hypothetical protein